MSFATNAPTQAFGSAEKVPKLKVSEWSSKLAAPNWNKIVELNEQGTGKEQIN